MSAELIARLRELAGIADRGHLLQKTASESLRDAAAAIEAQATELAGVRHGTSLLHDAWLTKWNEVAAERDAALLAAQPATTDRETIGSEVSRHHWQIQRDTDHEDTGGIDCSCGNWSAPALPGTARYRPMSDWWLHVADAILASGVLVPANKIRAEGVEAFAATWSDDPADADEHEVRQYALKFAAELRGES